MASAKVCVICRFEDWNSEKPFHILYEKGAALLNRAILARQDDLGKVPSVQMVHECCRKDYCSEKSIKQKRKIFESDAPQNSVVSVRTRSETSCFQMKGFCFLCCQRILDISRRNKGTKFLL